MYKYSPQTFVKRHGGYWFLPQSWQYQCLVRQPQDEEFGPWYAFLTQLAIVAAAEMKKIHLLGLAAYVILLWLVNLTRFLQNRRWSVHHSKKVGRLRSILMLRGMARLWLFYGMVIATALIQSWSLERSQWARNIRSRKAFRVPETPNLSRGNMVSLSPPIVPMRVDILSSTHYSWDAMAANSRMLELGHPGNQFWKQLTREYNPNFYVSARPSLQRDFCNHLASRIGTNKRVLKQISDRSWIVLSEEEFMGFCHSELVGEAFPLVGSLSITLKHLQNEAEFGSWRRTTMQCKTTPNFLRYLERKILSVLSFRGQVTQFGHADLMLPKISQSMICMLPSSSRVSVQNLRRVPSHDNIRQRCVHLSTSHLLPTEEPNGVFHDIPHPEPATTV